MCLYSYNILYFTCNQIRIGTWQVHLIYNRKYFQVMIKCHINIGKCLCLYTLCRVYYKYGTVTGSQRS